jgi:hypothetical protein
MRVSLLAAIVIGLLFMPLYAQTPEPQEVDTAQQAVEPEATEEAGEPEQATEPEAAEEAGEVEEVVEAAPVLSVQDMAFCTAVVEREPLSRDSSFSADIGQIFCWTNVLNDGGEGSVEHVWYYNGEEKARVELPANYARNRVWSSKKILPEWTGKWTVAVMAGSEKMGEMSCTIE